MQNMDPQQLQQLQQLLPTASPPPPPPPSQPQPEPLLQPHLPSMAAPPPTQPLQQAAPPETAAALPEIHFGQVANPSPNLVPPAPVSAPNHPPYAQMITEAITALKDRNGSSKRAIAKYIERVYSNSNLPSTHPALLTHHLKRLKEQGSLVMVKHSYKVARSPVGPPPVNGNGPKRRPGRPPKDKTGLAQPAPVASGVGPGPIPVQVPVTGPVSVPESVFASLGLVDVPVPMAVTTGPFPVPVSAPVVKRKPGRPRKVDAAGGVGVGLQPTPTLGKNVAGRPRKVAAKNAAPPGTGVVFPVSHPKLKKDGTPMKPRGRPPRKNLQVEEQNPAPLSVAPAAGSTLVPNVYVGEGVLAAQSSPAQKRRGRPPRAQNGPKAPRKLSGKPLGRPRKIAPAAVGQGPNIQQLLAFNEMRSKLDFFQSRIKQTVSILRPCLAGATAASALGALRELEELANLELGPPVTVQVPQPPPVTVQVPQNQA